jgi:methionine-gamma-lyase
MPAPRPSKTRIGNHVLKPETLMVGYGYDPALSEGAVKPPVFLTSTFVFRSARRVATSSTTRRGGGNRRPAVRPASSTPASTIQQRDRRGQARGLRGSGVLQPVRLGMAAITTTILAFARPGDVILHSQPLYGGTETLLANTLANFGIGAVGFVDGVTSRHPRGRAGGARQGPGIADPDRDAGQSDQHAGRYRAAAADRRRDRRAQGFRPVLACDNTLLGRCSSIR